MSRFGNLEFSGGEKQHEAATRESVKDEAYYLSEAQGSFEQAEFEKALRHYSKVLEFNPHNVQAWSGQVRALIELDEIKEARLWADKALERFPQDPLLLAAKAVALGRDGDHEAALAFSDASIEAGSDTPYLWLARADVLLARKENRAGFCLDKALLLAPQDWFIAWLAARIRLFYKQFSLAIQLIKRALDHNPAHFNLWFLLGQCQAEVGLTSSARISFAQATQLNPHSKEAAAALSGLESNGIGSRLSSWVRRLTHR